MGMRCSGQMIYGFRYISDAIDSWKMTIILLQRAWRKMESFWCDWSSSSIGNYMKLSSKIIRNRQTQTLRLWLKWLNFLLGFCYYYPDKQTQNTAAHGFSFQHCIDRREKSTIYTHARKSLLIYFEYHSALHTIQLIHKHIERGARLRTIPVFGSSTAYEQEP